MPTEAKRETIAELRQELAGHRTLIVSEYRGLTVKELSEIRRALRKQGVSYRVVKNRLMRIAAGEGHEGLSALLTGPTAIAFGNDEARTAKAVIDATRPYRLVKITGGVLGRRAINAEGVTTLATMPPREVVLAQVAGAIAAPLATTAGLFDAPLRDIAGLVTALADKRAGTAASAPDSRLRDIQGDPIPMANLTADQLLEAFEQMTVLELSEFKKKFEDRFGVTAAAPVAVAAAAAPAGVAAEAAPAEEQTEFAAVLTEVGPNKIQVIKTVRELTNLGLKEAKDLVDAAPKPIKEGVAKDEAEKIKAAIEAQGAKVEVK